MDRIRLPRAGRERVYLSVRAEPPFSPATTVEVQFGSGAWHPAGNVQVAGPVLTADILIAGPDWLTALDGAVQVVADCPVRYRLSDAPEVLLRGGSQLVLAD